jgi:hypothetical protein
VLPSELKIGGLMMSIIGAIGFGAVIGWMAHVAFSTERNVNIEWITSMIAVVAGAAVTGLFKGDDLFGAYSIGLAGAFFLRMFLFSPLIIWAGEETLGKKFAKYARAARDWFNEGSAVKREERPLPQELEHPRHGGEPPNTLA